MIPSATPAIWTAALALAGVPVGAALAFAARRLAAVAGSGSAASSRPMIGGAVAVGLWAGLASGDPAAAALTALLGWQLLLIAAVDAKHFWLPDQLTLPLAATGLLSAAALERLALVDSILGAAAGFACLWLLARAYRALRGREGLGGGDPFLLGAIGAWVGWIGLPGVLLWAALAGLAAVAGRAAAGRRVSGLDRLPFGVFLALGAWLVWLLGPPGL